MEDSAEAEEPRVAKMEEKASVGGVVVIGEVGRLARARAELIPEPRMARLRSKLAIICNRSEQASL